MKKLTMEQMESFEAQGWGSLACKIGFTAVGALMGPVGAISMGIAGNILCYPLEAR